MCGILGVIKIGNQRNFDYESSVAKEVLRHRGPDDYGSKIFKLKKSSIFFSHNRLSIIDLTTNGRQPFSTKDGDFEIIYNGEIYNYLELKTELKKNHNISFKSNTDTEVLLYGWKHYGRKFLDKLEGMFAFAIYDKKKDKIYICRDRLGIKSLYFSKIDNNFFFASELQAQLKVINSKQKLNYQRIYDYIQWDLRDYNDETFFENIFRVLPGQLIEIDTNTLQIKNTQWWHPSILENKKISYEEAKKTIKEKFLKSVNIHLRSDVTLGVALSGGIDSSAIVGAVRKLYPDREIKTFSFISTLKNQSEEKWVDIVSKKNSTLSHKTVINDINFSKDFEYLMEHLGEPFGSSSFFSSYSVFKLAKKSGIKVILDGQGGDEVLGGYFGYLPEKIHSAFQDNKFNSIILFLNLFFRSGTKKILLTGLLKKLIFSKTKLNIFLSFLINYQRNIFNNKFLFKKKININYKIISSNDGDSKKRQLVNELRNAMLYRGLPSLLRVGDRMSMAVSIESRVPFLNNELVEYCLKLPEDFLVNKDGLSKNIFRDAMSDILPDEILNRSDKKGFDSPDKIWMKNYLINNINELNAELDKLEILNSNKIKENLRNFLNDKKDLNMLNWRVINFIIWKKVFKKYIEIK